MTPEKREQLTDHLAEHGLSVLLTKDFDAILMQLARLAQFERLMLTAAAGNPAVEFAVEHVRYEQGDDDNTRPLEISDLPKVLTAAHKHLHDQLGKPARLDTHTVNAAVSAFVGILCRR